MSREKKSVRTTTPPSPPLPLLCTAVRTATTPLPTLTTPTPPRSPLLQTSCRSTHRGEAEACRSHKMEDQFEEGVEGAATPLEGGEGMDLVDESVMRQVNRMFPEKVEQAIESLVQAHVAQTGLSEQDAMDVITDLLDEPTFGYSIWRTILTDPDFQYTAEDRDQAMEASLLLDWLSTFGGNILEDHAVDMLLCEHFPNRYQELLDFLQQEHPHVPQYEFTPLLNKIRREDADGASTSMDHEGHVPPLQPVEKQEDPQVSRAPRLQQNNGRTKWLYENARIARMYQRHEGWEGNFLALFLQEVGISPGFRIFFTIWLVAASVLALAIAFHSLFVIISRVFTPVEYVFLTSTTLFSCFILSTILIGTFLTAIDRVLKGWIFIDDETYYGDQNFADSYNKKLEAEGDDTLDKVRNKVKHTECVHLLPPCEERTFLLLPGGKKGWWRRELWMGIIVVATTFAPFFYAIIAALADQENAYETLGRFVQWNLLTGLTFILLYWVYMWYHGMRMKYALFKRNKRLPGNVPKSRDLDLLQEWGLDESSVRRNIYILLIAGVPIFVMFWLQSYEGIRVTADWIITVAIVILALLMLREVWRSDSWKERVPFAITLLIAVFLIVGVVGAVKAESKAIIAFFLVLFLATQGMMVRHRQFAHVDEVTWLLEFVKTIDPRKDLLTPGSPLLNEDGSRVPTTPGQVARNARIKWRKGLKLQRAISEVSDPNREQNMMPFSRIFAAVFDIPCIRNCTKSSGDVAEGDLPVPDETQRGWWRLGNRYWGDFAVKPSIEEKARCEPSEKLVLAMSVKVLGWFMFIFFLSVLIMFQVGGDLQMGQGTQVVRTQTQTVPGDADPVSPPVCRMSFGSSRNTITDLALLTEIGMNRNEGHIINLLKDSFGETDDRVDLVPGWQCAEPGNAPFLQPVLNLHCSVTGGPKTAVDTPRGDFFHFYVRSTGQSYITFATEKNDETSIRDLDLFGESMVYQAFSSIVPFPRLFSDSIAGQFVDNFASIKRAIDGDAYTEQWLVTLVGQYLDAWKAKPKYIHNYAGTGKRHTVAYKPPTILGHGANGALAKILAARFGLPVVTFNAPGTEWLKRRYDLNGAPRNQHHELNVLATNDISNVVGLQGGAIQYIGYVEDV